LTNFVFYGSLSVQAGYFDGFGDRIVDGVFDLPSQSVRICGSEDRKRNAKSRYWVGDYEAAKFANHYWHYFGNNYGVIEYSSGVCDRGNLLVIGDSFDNCIEPLLAAHFRHCWFVDLRFYAQDVGEEFDLGEFIACHKITDVLFIGAHSWILGLRSLGTAL